MYNDEQTFQSKAPVIEQTLKSAELHIEHKSFVFLLKENSGGRFLRIIEQAGEKHSSVIVPSTGLEEFRKAVDGMMTA